MSSNMIVGEIGEMEGGRGSGFKQYLEKWKVVTAQMKEEMKTHKITKIIYDKN